MTTVANFYQIRRESLLKLNGKNGSSVQRAKQEPHRGWSNHVYGSKKGADDLSMWTEQSVLTKMLNQDQNRFESSLDQQLEKWELVASCQPIHDPDHHQDWSNDSMVDDPTRSSLEDSSLDPTQATHQGKNLVLTHHNKSNIKKSNSSPRNEIPERKQEEDDKTSSGFWACAAPPTQYNSSQAVDPAVPFDVDQRDELQRPSPRASPVAFSVLTEAVESEQVVLSANISQDPREMRPKATSKNATSDSSISVTFQKREDSSLLSPRSSPIPTTSTTTTNPTSNAQNQDEESGLDENCGTLFLGCLDFYFPFGSNSSTTSVPPATTSNEKSTAAVPQTLREHKQKDKTPMLEMESGES